MPARVMAWTDAADEILRTGDTDEIQTLVSAARRIVIIGRLALSLEDPFAGRPEVVYVPVEQPELWR